MTKRILIVEHDPETARHLFLLFHAHPGHTKDERFEVELAVCLSEAIEKIQIIRFHCIIMDVNIAASLGIDAISHLRTADNNPPIIATAKINNLALETKAREHDVFFYYINSDDPSELKLAVTCAAYKALGISTCQNLVPQTPRTTKLKPLKSIYKIDRDTA